MFSPSLLAIQFVDHVTNKQQKLVNPTPRSTSFFNFGIVPGFAPNNSLIFFPPPPAPTSPKQPRHTSPLEHNNGNNFEKAPKKTQKVKVKDARKQSKSKNDGSSNKAKKLKQIPVPKTFRSESSSYPRAKRCIPEACQPPHCQCGGIDNPGKC